MDHPDEDPSKRWRGYAAWEGSLRDGSKVTKSDTGLKRVDIYREGSFRAVSASDPG
jgi:hypothetical protein